MHQINLQLHNQHYYSRVMRESSAMYQMNHQDEHVKPIE